MISYAGSPGHEMVAALGVLLVAVAVVAVRRRRKRAGREPAVAVPSAMSAMVDVVEPPSVAPAPAPVEPRVEVFRVAARRPGVHNSRFARGAGARPAEGARHFATAPANRR
jgi:hypothetical protein